MLERLTKTCAFQIVQLITGYAITSVGTCTYFLRPDDLFFTRSDEARFWSVSADATIHYCAVRPEYLIKTPYMVRLIRDHQVFTGNPAVTSISDAQRAFFSMLFRVIADEATSAFEDKQEAILLHLQMMFLYINRICSSLPDCGTIALRFHLLDGIGELLKTLFYDDNRWLRN